MSESDEIIQRLMLLILRAYEQITALKYALQEQGLLTPEMEEATMARSEARWLRERKRIEKGESADAALQERLLKEFEGPPQ
jgi:hypothetical protein